MLSTYNKQELSASKRSDEQHVVSEGIMLSGLEWNQYIGRIITHDNMLAPFIITVTGTGINMRQYESSTEEWVDYVSVVLFIKHVDDTFYVIPVKHTISQ